MFFSCRFNVCVTLYRHKEHTIVSTHLSSKTYFLKVKLKKKNNPKKDPNGGKWSLVGVLNPALSNKSNYSQRFKLMDPTEECNLTLPVNHHLFSHLTQAATPRFSALLLLEDLG